VMIRSPEPPAGPTIFLSYTRSDVDAARKLERMLWSFGFHVWIDEAGLPPGTPQWDQQIRAALGSSCVVVVLCSTAVRTSDYVAIEIAIAQGLGLPILPVWIEGSMWTESCPVSLTLAQHVDLRSPDRHTATLRLRDTLIRILLAHQMPAHDDKTWISLRVTCGRNSTHKRFVRIASAIGLPY
jgi:hypothetical protein